MANHRLPTSPFTSGEGMGIPEDWNAMFASSTAIAAISATRKRRADRGVLELRNRIVASPTLWSAATSRTTEGRVSDGMMGGRVRRG
ncbi:MAG: hypothetical protein Rubg2KO_29900 [Rubricoccaceae bacterium]